MTKSEIKVKLTKLYQLRKELNQNLVNTKLALKDVDNCINELTNLLQTMKEGMKA